MRNWLKKKIKQWYLRYCDTDLVAMTRIQLAGVKAGVDISEMSEEEEVMFRKECESIVKNKAFEKVINELILKQKDFTVCYSENIRQGDFGRATINGISLVKETFNLYASGQKEKEEDFDPYAVV